MRHGWAGRLCNWRFSRGRSTTSAVSRPRGLHHRRGGSGGEERWGPLRSPSRVRHLRSPSNSRHLWSPSKVCQQYQPSSINKEEILSSRTILDRLKEGIVQGAEGYVFELERRGYIKAGPYVPEVVLDFPEAVKELHRGVLPARSE